MALMAKFRHECHVKKKKKIFFSFYPKQTNTNNTKVKSFLYITRKSSSLQATQALVHPYRTERPAISQMRSFPPSASPSTNATTAPTNTISLLPSLFTSYHRREYLQKYSSRIRTLLPLDSRHLSKPRKRLLTHIERATGHLTDALIPTSSFSVY